MLYWVLAALLGGYLIGCLHGSVVARLLTGVNLKKEGVKNSGASNAAIVLGPKFGALVAFVDISKGAVAVIALRMVLDGTALSPEQSWTLLFVAGAGTVLGHNYPFYMNFDGGKGTATLIGMMLALDWKLGIAGGLLLIAVSLLTDYLIIGVLVLYGILLVIAFWPAVGLWPLVTAFGLFGLALWKHTENIGRLMKGTESKVSSVFRKKTAG